LISLFLDKKVGPGSLVLSAFLYVFFKSPRFRLWVGTMAAITVAVLILTCYQ
jgi:ABC-type uncharacterized transport system permease subunit